MCVCLCVCVSHFWKCCLIEIVDFSIIRLPFLAMCFTEGCVLFVCVCVCVCVLFLDIILPSLSISLSCLLSSEMLFT